MILPLITTSDIHYTEFEKKINKELGKITLWLKLNKLSLNGANSNFMVFYQIKKENIYSNNRNRRY